VAKSSSSSSVLRLVRPAPADEAVGGGVPSGSHPRAAATRRSPSSADGADGVHAQVGSSFDDSELLAAIRRGDDSAALSLYRRARPQVERTIIHLIGARDPDFDDLVQTSMIALVHSLDRFRGECSLDTWTARITAHAVYKELRRRRTIGRLMANARAIELTGPQSASITRASALRNAIEKVQTHLNALDPVKAWTVLLHDVCGYDLREIAEITEASVTAAQSRLVRGRAELHARIEADPDLANALHTDAEELD
jgi:RNA polymerase sigma-70 factor, ECF subfamily